MWLLAFPRRALCKRVSANIAPTNYLAKLLQLPQTMTVYHGVRAPTSDVAGFCNGSPPTFVFLGRLVSSKGVPLLLHAAHRLKELGVRFRIRIIGDGPERSKLEQLMRELQVEECVTFCGSVPEDQLEDMLAGTFAIVLPSQGGEVFGLVVAEMMGRSRLAIVPSGGPMAEVAGDTGLAFLPGDAAALASCMKRIVEDPSLAADLGGRAARRASEIFGERSMVQQHVAIYRGLLH